MTNNLSTNDNKSNEVLDQINNSILNLTYYIYLDSTRIRELETQNKTIIKQNQQLKEKLDKLLQSINPLSDTKINDLEPSIPKTKGKKDFLAIKSDMIPMNPLNWDPDKQQKVESITDEIYNDLIKESSGNSYSTVRSRVAICLLALTGSKLNRLLSIRAQNIRTLLKTYSMAKSGLLHTTFDNLLEERFYLNQYGRKLLDQRKEDFEFLLFSKKPDSYLFTSVSKHNRMIRRETLMRHLNQILTAVSDRHPEQPILSSYSFRSLDSKNIIMNVWTIPKSRRKEFNNSNT